MRVRISACAAGGGYIFAAADHTRQLHAGLALPAMPVHILPGLFDATLSGGAFSIHPVHAIGIGPADSIGFRANRQQPATDAPVA